jgi:hypothetical protein
MPDWTFDSLARAGRKELEELIASAPAPDYAQIEGWTYLGWNQQKITELTGRKFRKGFRPKAGRKLGYNELIHQDRKGPGGEWPPKLKDGRPVQVGYYEVSPAGNAALLDYNIDLNTGRNLLFRAIRDLVVLPNPGAHELMLGKANLQLGFTIFISYFVLGHRRPIEHEPW